MCRSGRMFAPTKTFRRWHRKVNKNQRRFAVASSLAASALPSLLMARGHRIAKVKEVPLVISDSAESLTRTKEAVALLKRINAFSDVQKVIFYLFLFYFDIFFIVETISNICCFLEKCEQKYQFQEIQKMEFVNLSSI